MNPDDYLYSRKLRLDYEIYRTKRIIGILTGSIITVIILGVVL